MDEHDILTPEEEQFTLEDILREFGSGTQEQEPSEQEQIAAPVEEDIPAVNPEEDEEDYSSPFWQEIRNAPAEEEPGKYHGMSPRGTVSAENFSHRLGEILIEESLSPDEHILVSLDNETGKLKYEKMSTEI